MVSPPGQCLIGHAASKERSDDDEDSGQDGPFARELPLENGLEEDGDPDILELDGDSGAHRQHVDRQVVGERRDAADGAQRDELDDLFERHSRSEPQRDEGAQYDDGRDELPEAHLHDGEPGCGGDLADRPSEAERRSRQKSQNHGGRFPAEADASNHSNKPPKRFPADMDSSDLRRNPLLAALFSPESPVVRRDCATGL